VSTAVEVQQGDGSWWCGSLSMCFPYLTMPSLYQHPASTWINPVSTCSA